MCSGKGKLEFTEGPKFRYQLPPGNNMTTGMQPANMAWNKRIRKVLSPGITGQNNALRNSSDQRTSIGKGGLVEDAPVDSSFEKHLKSSAMLRITVPYKYTFLLMAAMAGLKDKTCLKYLKI